MELKEIVNLRKLREFYENTLEDELCENCPCRYVCGSYNARSNDFKCLIEKMIDIEADSRDLYDLEADGDLSKDFQIKAKAIL